MKHKYLGKRVRVYGLKGMLRSDNLNLCLLFNNQYKDNKIVSGVGGVPLPKFKTTYQNLLWIGKNHHDSIKLLG